MINEYFKIVREICDRYNIILIFDEIITGFAKTGAMFAAQSFGVDPDIICCGKGISKNRSHPDLGGTLLIYLDFFHVCD